MSLIEKISLVTNAIGWELYHDDPNHEISFTPDGKAVVVVTEQETLRLHRAATRVLEHLGL